MREQAGAHEEPIIKQSTQFAEISSNHLLHLL